MVNSNAMIKETKQMLKEPHQAGSLFIGIEKVLFKNLKKEYKIALKRLFSCHK